MKDGKNSLLCVTTVRATACAWRASHGRAEADLPHRSPSCRQRQREVYRIQYSLGMSEVFKWVSFVSFGVIKALWVSDRVLSTFGGDARRDAVQELVRLLRYFFVFYIRHSRRATGLPHMTSRDEVGPINACWEVAWHSTADSCTASC